VARFNRTLNQEWAYAQTYLSDDARAATYQAWVHHYNHWQHSGIGGKSPFERLNVHNLPVKNSRGVCRSYSGRTADARLCVGEIRRRERALAV
jgi:hypothetical protein